MVKAEVYDNCERITIVKKIAKHGKQAIIIVPKILEETLKPNTIVKLNIEIIRRPE